MAPQQCVQLVDSLRVALSAIARERQETLEQLAAIERLLHEASESLIVGDTERAKSQLHESCDTEFDTLGHCDISGQYATRAAKILGLSEEWSEGV